MGHTLNLLTLILAYLLLLLAVLSLSAGDILRLLSPFQ
jgi:hypothetical protein